MVACAGYQDWFYTSLCRVMYLVYTYGTYQTALLHGCDADLFCNCDCLKRARRDVEKEASGCTCIMMFFCVVYSCAMYMHAASSVMRLIWTEVVNRLHYIKFNQSRRIHNTITWHSKTK